MAQMILDLHDLFKCLRLKRDISVNSPPTLTTVNHYSSVMIDDIARLQHTVQNILHAPPLALNRSEVSPKVLRLERVHDLFTLSSRFLCHQFLANANIFQKLISAITNNAPLPPDTPESLIKYIVTRHPYNGMAIHLLPQNPMPVSLLSSTSGSLTRLIDADLEAKRLKREHSVSRANSLVNTFDRSSSTVMDESI